MGGSGMMSDLRAILTHARVRTLTLCRRPVSLLMMLFVAGMSVLLWPGLAGPSGPWFGFKGLSSADTPLMALMIALMYLYLWPMIATLRAAGRATGFFSSGDDKVTLTLPALPIGPKARMAGEVTVVLAFVLAARVSVLPLLAAADRAPFISATFSGALIMLPALLCWAKRTGSFELQSAMGLVVALLELGAHKLGLLAGFTSLVPVAIVLSAAVLLFDGRYVLGLRRTSTRMVKASSRVRPALPPEARYRRDLVFLPMRRYGLVYLFLLCLGAAIMLLRILSDVAFLAGVALAFLAVLILLKPLGSNLLGWGLKGRRGVRPGDLYRALSVLPLKRETILRGIYFYTLVSVAAIWVAAASFIALRVYLRTGEPLWRMSQRGDLNLFLWPSLLLIPAVAGFIVSAAAGNRALYYTNGLALFAMMNLPMLALATLTASFGKESNAPVIIAIVLLGRIDPTGVDPAAVSPEEGFVTGAKGFLPRAVSGRLKGHLLLKGI